MMTKTQKAVAGRVLLGLLGADTIVTAVALPSATPTTILCGLTVGWTAVMRHAGWLPASKRQQRRSSSDCYGNSS